MAERITPFRQENFLILGGFFPPNAKAARVWEKTCTVETVGYENRRISYIARHFNGGEDGTCFFLNRFNGFQEMALLSRKTGNIR